MLSKIVIISIVSFALNCNSNSNIGDNNIICKSSLIGEWIAIDQDESVNIAIQIWEDSILFQHRFGLIDNHCFNKLSYRLDSITSKNYHWISTFTKNNKKCSGYCIVAQDDFLYITTLKGLPGITDHFTSCSLYRKKTSNTISPEYETINEIEIILDETLEIEYDCQIAHNKLSNVFYIAFNQDVQTENSNKIHFRYDKFTKTQIKVDLRAFYHKRYKLIYKGKEIPLVFPSGIDWKEKFDLNEWLKSKEVNDISLIAIISRFNPSRDSCNNIFGEKITGQIQDFEILPLSCFIERLNR